MKEPWQVIPDDMEDASPLPGYVRDVVREQGFTWVQCLGSLIDHAIKAEATNVYLILTSEGLTICDDGQGCAKPATTFVVPRPVVGVSYAALALGDYVNVTTVHEGTKRTLGCDYAALANAGDWDLDVDAEPTTDGSWTNVTIKRFVQPMPPSTSLRKALHDHYASLKVCNLFYLILP